MRRRFLELAAIAASLASLIVAAMTLWNLRSDLRISPPTSEGHVVFLIDTSLSMRAESRAASLSTVETILKTLEASPDSRLTVTLFATGSPRTGYAPVRLLSQVYPYSGPEGSGKNRGALEAALLAHEMMHVLNAQPASPGSPIFMAVRSAVDNLRADTGSSKINRRLIIVSDMLETVDPPIARTLNEPVGARISLPFSIDNSDVNIMIWDIADHRSPLTLSERSREVWSRLFTEPSRVRFEYALAR